MPESGRVVGRGWTRPGGRPHAETEALRRAGALAKGATAYVSLEPCNHHGETPPCTEALIAAGVARVVVAMEDPDPRVSGAGLARLRDAGAAVTGGVCGDEAAALNAGFVMRQRSGRPLVRLKVASTLDGRIALASGESQWITGPAARRHGHLLRAQHDGIMVGIGTALADDPSLTCRLPGLEERSPVGIVVDGTLRLPADSALALSARDRAVWVVTGQGCGGGRRTPLEALGVEVIEVPVGEDGRPVLASALAALGERGLTRVLVEGGATLAAGLVRADLVDRIAWYRSNGVIGGDGLAAVSALGLESLDAMARFDRDGFRAVGADLLETLAKRH
jgi:diaminohydroxyphosphoribosylaminopyrimidine deaminase/5-amino-6-(5-phosphoribosylamino)uracil reductase